MARKKRQEVEYRSDLGDDYPYTAGEYIWDGVKSDHNKGMGHLTSKDNIRDGLNWIKSQKEKGKPLLKGDEETIKALEEKYPLIGFSESELKVLKKRYGKENKIVSELKVIFNKGDKKRKSNNKKTE